MQLRRIIRSLLAIALALVVSSAFLGHAQAARSWPTLRSGDFNENVWTLQAMLSYRGYSVSTTSSYDSATTNAVFLFEQNNGIPQDGVADPVVWEKLFVTVRQGDSNVVVQALQRQLRNNYGYTKTIASADQVFGPATNSAVVSFQKSVNLTADGIAGGDTWSNATSGNAARIHHSSAMAQLQGAGITVDSSLGSAGVGQDRVGDKTSLEQIRSLTITRVIDLRQASGCAVTITGGSETWTHSSGTISHHTGYKVDVRKTTCVTTYITSHFTQIATRSDGAAQYQSSSGVYADEGDHWDIYYTS